VSIFYTAPTGDPRLRALGRRVPGQARYVSLRVLGTVGEPINPEAGCGTTRDRRRKLPIVDTWWQTETGGIMISPLPGITGHQARQLHHPFFGVAAEVVKRDGTRCAPNEGGFLILRKPWPSMLRGIHGDPERYVKQYWTEIKGAYFTGDGARQDEDGYFWVMGRVDDVLNVAGHRLGTAEIESALVSHRLVAESAVVGPPHELKGQAIYAFVTLKAGNEPSDTLKKELSDHVVKEIGALARPTSSASPTPCPRPVRARSCGRLLKEIAAGGVAKGDTTTLEDIGVLTRLAASAKKRSGRQT
jgi:acetyl-CoA synthetase